MDKMASIISTKRDKESIIAEITLNEDELRNLQGHFDNIHLFTEKGCDIVTNIASRGTKEATKYFLIPRILRKDMHFDKKVACQKIEQANKTIFVYLINK